MTSASSDVREAVRTFVIRNFLFGQAESLNDGGSFLEAGMIDSTGVLELVGFLETTYSITVADADIVPANLDSVDRVVGFVARKLKERETHVAG